LDYSTVSHEAARSFNDPVTVSSQPGSHQGQACCQNRRLGDGWRSSTVRASLAQVFAGRAIRIVQTLVCTGVLVCVGCGQGDSGSQDSGSQQSTEEQRKAQREELLKRFPKAPPDTPEQIQEKKAFVEQSLPMVYELLEEGKTSPTKLEEAVQLSMKLAAELPSHREARIAWCRTTLASFLAKENETDEDGRFVDAFNMGVRIRSAALAVRNFQKMFGDLSEDETQLFQEIFFNMARFQCLLNGEEAAKTFNDAIRDLMNLGFSDLERLKAEPRFEDFFTNPTTAPVLQAAIEQMEASAEDGPETDTSEDDASSQPE
jgi:hypothetical protein